KNLSNTLGDDSVETKSTIDLRINNREFFKKTFPYFQELNQKLNSRTGERIEHDTINIVFRYARTKNLPLDYVGFLFSKRTKYPLLIKVHFKNDDLNIIKTLYERYGTPEIIPWKQENGKSLCWKKARDILVLSFVPDEFGNPEYEIVIYFANALESLITTEQQKRQQDFLESGKKIF
ncbi:MAG: hypothetical protein U9N77_04385, partial [Thermodesulfobacteriota bacterium]|nr:hypothetical protein [Thermodesulfobacteriota bacterium]